MPGNWVGIGARREPGVVDAGRAAACDPPRDRSRSCCSRSGPTRSARARREAVAYNAQTESLLYDWQIGAGHGRHGQRERRCSRCRCWPRSTTGITTELAITNLVPKPGFTDFAIFIYDQNGLLDYVCQKLNEKQVEYIDLATWGAINPRFMGSRGGLSATFWEHDVFDGTGQFQRNLVGLGGVAVERIGGTLGRPDVPGDESKAFEAFPVFDHFETDEAPNCPGIPGRSAGPQ